MHKYFHNLKVGYDTYERHRLIASLLCKQSTKRVLDVGGAPGLLAGFIGGSVTVTNLSGGNIISNGLHLPFTKQSFDIVTSLDVLEHIQKVDRQRFIDELMRVARRQVIICTPFGSIDHLQSEAILLKKIIYQGTPNKMLEEHVRFGLPTLQEMEANFPQQKISKAIYSGDFRINNLLFSVDHALIRIKVPRFFRFVISLILNLIGNLFIYPFAISTQPRRFTNRMTVVHNKNSLDI